jgi:transposase
VGLILPRCNTAAMNLLMPEISAKVAPGKHAVLLMDQAGWLLSDKLCVPTNITVLPLPPKCLELNPAENVWEFVRDNWLSNRVFTCYNKHRPPLLRCLEQAHRSALAHYDPRTATLGSRVAVIETWY